MARFEVGNGLSEYIHNIDVILQQSDELLKRSIYPGAGLVADAINSAIDTIPSATYRRTKDASGKVVNVRKGITDVQRQGLHDGLGIASFRNQNGYLNVKVGFIGYNNQKTKAYPSGQPNALIAASCESGSVYQTRTPFISKVIKATRAAAEQAIAEAYDEQIEKMTEE